MSRVGKVAIRNRLSPEMLSLPSASSRSGATSAASTETGTKESQRVRSGGSSRPASSVTGITRGMRVTRAMPRIQSRRSMFMLSS